MSKVANISYKQQHKFILNNEMIVQGKKSGHLTKPNYLKVSDPSKLIQLLILLKDTVPQPVQQEFSEYGKKLLGQAAQSKDQQMVKPDKSEYINTDTSIIDRDKNQNIYYTSYNNLTFENSSFLDSTQESIKFEDMMKRPNRFNDTFSKPFSQITNEQDSRNSQNTFLFGAMQRIQPINHSKDSNPFGIKFEIPPLPSISGIESQLQIPSNMPNFFSFIKAHDNSNQSSQQSIKNENSNNSQGSAGGIQWISKQKTHKKSEAKTSPPYNRRQLKEYNKKSANKRSLIWNLMPHFDESLVKSNLKEESGIQRLWEDESIDIKLRDLRLCESGLLTSVKCREFNKAFLKYTDNNFEIYEKKVFTESEVIQMALLMLQGVPSQLFLLKNENLTFILRPNFEIRNYSLNQESASQIFESMIESGGFFLHLREFTEFMSYSQNNGGMILQNFVLALSDFLTFYYNQINELWSGVEARRKYEDLTMFNIVADESTQKQINSQMTILELCIHTSQLQKQIRLMATICFTQKFIKDLEQIDDKKVISEQLQEKTEDLKKVIYHGKNLREKFQIDIDKIRSRVWMENFPRGAQLLSYLYLILLCFESDLQAVDLLRRIFQKSIQPLLSMINSFIFTGDFDDPYGEFFVEKLYRRGVEANILQIHDYLFKLTSNPQKKIPIFMVDSVSVIFKAGSSLHLLRKQGNQLSQYHDTTAIKQYYEICTSGINKISEVKMNTLGNQYFKFHHEAFNQMHLDFQIQHLRENQESKTKHFEDQTEKLQQIEMTIVQQEEEYFFRQVILREEAKRDYALKREIEMEKERKVIRDRKEAYMREIQEQLAEKQQRKDKEKEDKIKENEVIRKEQQEYEMRKKAIEEELKRQYLEIIKENQKLGEVTKDIGKQDEDELDRQIQQIMEQKKEEDIQIQMQDQPPVLRKEIQLNTQNQSKIQDVEMKDENPLKNDEMTLVQQQLEIDNPLLSIINDALLKAQINLNQSQIKEEIMIDMNPIEQPSQLLKLEEIEFIDSETPNDERVDQSKPQETDHQMIQIVIETFLKPLFEKINSRINDIENIKKKRLTWNRIRKDEKIQKFQEIKSKWRYQEPQISVQSKLNNIFKEFESVLKVENDQQDEIAIGHNQVQLKIESENRVNAYSVPVSLALHQCVVTVVKDQYKLVNKCLIHLMFRRLNLFKHLEGLKQFFFCYQGDVISYFMASIFNDDSESTIKENTLSFINGQLDLAVRLSSSERALDINTQENKDLMGNFNLNTLGENFEFQALNMTGLNQNKNFFFTAFNRLPWKEYHKIRKIQLLRNKMHHFTSTLEQYALTEVIHSSWQTFKNNLPHQYMFEDLIRLHNDFLDQIMIKCFIDKKDHKIMGQITKLFSFVIQFSKLVKEYGAQIVNQKEAIDEVHQISDSFERYTYYLYQLVKHLAHKGSFKELFLLLDFNKFYDRGNALKFEELSYISQSFQLLQQVHSSRQQIVIINLYQILKFKKNKIMSGINAINNNLIANHNPAASSAQNSNGMKLDLNIEAPFIKIVHESFKSHKKYIEKEVNLIVTKINAIKKQGSTKGAQTVIDTIDQLISKLNQLKTKYNKMLEAEDYLFQVMKKRLQHLNFMNENQVNPEVMKDYFTKRLNRIIIDYMLRENYFDSAQIYIEETGLKDFVDLEVFEETSKILAKLKQRDCQDALTWCNTHKTKLQKLNFGEDQKFLNIIQQVMGFLIFRNDQRDKYEFYRLFALPDTPMISQSLSTGIPLLKTEFCMHNDSANQSCPTCACNIRKLGQKLPFSHQTQTCITCVVTGELMNDQNQPLFLPSGHIISERGLKLIRDQSEKDKVICPFTNQSISQNDVRKVFFS
ncbi:lissencephaly type-1-like motif-containing protein [Stylonychia lemnae]|uniref:Lissencephaly type-1-like motif-containing protein n=1 Tax=Stylonychia lemnae TaxID=5949 RepID=A0A078AAJ1_STYLE|nr:lissencephaly type-1-like motif-containing protein [Stylonychia lemnae]|eukprot:CDW78602.1 lissencephaly type-1-like motif-containing protein [Stylonychia lemnae]